MWDFLWYELRSTGNGHSWIILWELLCNLQVRSWPSHQCQKQKSITELGRITPQVPRSSYSKNGWNCPNICGWLNHLWDRHGLFVDPPCQVLPLLIEVRFLHSIFCMAMALDGASQPLAYQAHQASWKLCAWEGLYGQGPRSQGSTKSPGCRGEIFHYFCWPPKKEREREREMYMYRFLHRYIHINKKTSETNI